MYILQAEQNYLE